MREKEKDAAYKREQAAKKADHEKQLQEREQAAQIKQQEEEAAYRRHMEKQQKESEERDKQRKHELEMAQVRQNIPTTPNPLTPVVVPPHRKFPNYKAGKEYWFECNTGNAVLEMLTDKDSPILFQHWHNKGVSFAPVNLYTWMRIITSSMPIVASLLSVQLK
nr:PHD finger protein 14-like [Chelonoidis abingdonii]